jgi:hypothetical protein
MSEIEYDLGLILDKKDFSVHLMEQANPSDLNFCKESKTLSFFMIDGDSQTELDYKAKLNILNENPKGIIPAADSYFHFFSDFIGPIYVFLERCISNDIKKIEIVVVEMNYEHRVFKQLTPFLKHCLDSFSDKIEIVHTTIKPTETEHFFEINNSTIIPQQDIGVSIDFIYNSSKNFSNSLSTNTPNKKVFISRKMDVFKDDSDNRNLYQDEVENFFKSIGFQVVNGEGFRSLKEQMRFFNEVEIFAGFTGSGLTSSMFMQPGQTLIEIVCPLKFVNADSSEYEIHNFYKTISLLKKHKYVAISNINNSKEDLIKQLKDVVKML